jgi:hypothetical protein
MRARQPTGRRSGCAAPSQRPPVLPRLNEGDAPGVGEPELLQYSGIGCVGTVEVLGDAPHHLGSRHSAEFMDEGDHPSRHLDVRYLLHEKPSSRSRGTDLAPLTGESREFLTGFERACTASEKGTPSTTRGAHSGASRSSLWDARLQMLDAGGIARRAPAAPASMTLYCGGASALIIKILFR